MNEPFSTALRRGVISAVAVGGLSFFTVGQVSGLEAGLWAAGASAFGVLAMRFGAEGYADTKKAP
jgi:hypothetical protein